MGSGELSIGDTDSTFYKTYDLNEGKIEIKYRGDWYSEFCYVTYMPTSETKGQLKVDGDFVGDQNRINKIECAKRPAYNNSSKTYALVQILKVRASKFLQQRGINTNL